MASRLPTFCLSFGWMLSLSPMSIVTAMPRVLKRQRSQHLLANEWPAVGLWRFLVGS